ncbi:MAG: helix-turn-helix transcriptional regulator [Tepidisphaeraceae bacterium]
MSPKAPIKNVGYYLRVYRAKWRLSQKQAASHARVGVSYWSLLEAGKRRPSIEVAVRLRRLTGIPIDRFVEDP